MPRRPIRPHEHLVPATPSSPADRLRNWEQNKPPTSNLPAPESVVHATGDLPDPMPAPGGYHRLKRLPKVLWTIEAVWPRVDAAGKVQTWMELRSPDHGTFMLIHGDPLEALHTLPRYAARACQELQPARACVPVGTRLEA